MNPNSPMQTLVVHLDQLTPENMLQLSQAGYTILRDPALLIFARPLPQGQELQAIPQQADGSEETGVVQLPQRRTT